MTTCVICCDPIERDELALVCKHVFHRGCIADMHGDLCPLCRHPIEPGQGLSEAALNEMRKRKREDAQNENAAALQELLPTVYIGPGTPYALQAMVVMLDELGDVKDLWDAQPEEMAAAAHNVLHGGVFARTQLQCDAIIQFALSTRLCFAPAQRTGGETIQNAGLYAWLKERIPVIPPGLLHGQAYAHFSNLDRHTIDVHVRCAWRALCGAQLLGHALSSRV